MSLTYIFAKPVSILTNGQEYLVEDVELTAPTGRIQNIFARLDAEYGKLQKIFADDAQASIKDLTPEAMAAALSVIQEKEAAKGNEANQEPSIEDQIETFKQQIKSSGFNLTTSYTILKDILTQNKGGAKMIAETGSFDLKSGHWDSLPMTEIKGLLAFYIINFIVGLD